MLVIIVHTIDDELDVHSYEECITNVVSTWVCPQFDTKLCECDELAKRLLFQLLNRLGVRLVWAGKVVLERNNRMMYVRLSFIQRLFS